MTAEGIHLQGDSSNALTVYSHARVDGLSLDSRTFDFCRESIKIKQQWQADKRGGTDIGFGASVYNGAFVLSAYLESHPDLVKGKKLIELGSGPGLCSIVAVKAGAKKVLCTDGDPISVALAQENIKANCSTKQVHRGVITSKKLYWGNTEDLAESKTWLDGPIDVIIASDVVALPYKDAYDALLQTFDDLSDSHTEIFLCYQRRHKSETTFFTALQERFAVEEVDKEHMHPDFRNNPVTPMVIYRIHQAT
jgi:predicted nicotinamide N-methyase